MAAQSFYYVPEVATELRRSEAAVRWLLHTGALQSTKLGGRRVVTAKQLSDFLGAALAEVG